MLQAWEDSVRANLNCNLNPSLCIRGALMLTWRVIVLSNAHSAECSNAELELDLSGHGGKIS